MVLYPYWGRFFAPLGENDTQGIENDRQAKVLRELKSSACAALVCDLEDYSIPGRGLMKIQKIISAFVCAAPLYEVRRRLDQIHRRGP
jgi:hypothetical protein